MKKENALMMILTREQELSLLEEAEKQGRVNVVKAEPAVYGTLNKAMGLSGWAAFSVNGMSVISKS